MALGYMHLHGLGTPVNVSAAIDYYEGAASMGYADACYYLGTLYGGEVACAMAFVSNLTPHCALDLLVGPV